MAIAAARTTLSPDQSARVRAYLASRPMSVRPAVVGSAPPRSVERTGADRLALGLGTGATLLNVGAGITGSNVAGSAGAALSAAASAKRLADAIDSGDATKAVSAGLGLTQPALLAAKQMGLVSAELVTKVTPYLALAGIPLGIATHDPGAVASGIGSTAIAAGVASGVLGGGAALATGGLAAIPALAMMGGSMREASIEKGYGKEAKKSVAALTASPDYQSLAYNLARYRAGDMSVLPNLVNVAALAATASDRLGQPKGGSSIGGGSKIVQEVYRATKGTPGYDSVVRGVAGSLGWDATTSDVHDPYAFLTRFPAVRAPDLPASYNVPPVPPSPSPATVGFGINTIQSPSENPDPWASYRPAEAPAERVLVPGAPGAMIGSGLEAHTESAPSPRLGPMWNETGGMGISGDVRGGRASQQVGRRPGPFGTYF